MSQVPPAPKGAKAAGKRLWADVVERYDLEERELVLLRQAVSTVDVLGSLQEAIDADGPLLFDGPEGRPRAHPAAVEARQSRIALARILAALRLPEEDAEDMNRPHARVGIRGVYRMPGAS